MKRVLKVAGVALLAILIAIQFVPVHRSTQAGTGDPDASVQWILRAMIGALSTSHRMPLWYYVTLHPDARLAPEELTALQAWAQQPARASLTRP